jgi:hypothetical protein
MNKIEKQEDQFIADLKEIVNSSRQFAYSAVNFAKVRQNWLIGQRIVLQEQDGKTRARYSILNDDKQLFTSQYMDYLPTEKELEEEIERQKAILKLSITKAGNDE